MTHDPAPTRKDGQGGSRVPPTRRDDTPSSPRSWGLPPGLAAAYPDASPQQTLGGEADIYLVTASTGEQRVLKLYREGIRVDAKVRQLLPGLTQKLRHAVSVFEIGQDDGRDYEIQEYLPLGRIDAARNWSGEQIATIVKQITETLAALHAQGIVHRDLKPGNILLRDDNAPTIAITDFGISRILDQTRDFTDRRHGTVSYAPPEAQIDMPVVSAAWDWWSLGVLVRELASDAPIAAVSDPVLQFRIVTGDIDLSMVADQRCRLLCQGLLQRDPGRRWTATEIRAWLVGDSPPAPPDPSIADSRLRDDGTPTVWPEVTFTGEPELAEAIGKDWEGAAAYFCPGPDLVTPDWEPRLHRLLPNVDRGRHQRLSEILRGRESAPVQLVRFIQALDPQRPVGYGGYRLDPPRLAAVARVGTDSQDDRNATVTALVSTLFDRELLRAMATMPGGHRLRVIGHSWHRYVAHWRDRYSSLGDPLAWLLYLAADKANAIQDLTAQLVKNPAHDKPGWFNRLANSDDPVDVLAALHRYGEAEREAAR